MRDGKLQSICRWNETALKSVLGPFAESDDLIFREKDSSKISEQHQNLKKSENKRFTIHHCLMRGWGNVDDAGPVFLLIRILLVFLRPPEPSFEIIFETSRAGR